MLGKTVILATAPPDPIRLRGGGPAGRASLGRSGWYTGTSGCGKTIRTGRSAVFHPLCPGVARTRACTPDLINLGRWTKQEGTRREAVQKEYAELEYQGDEEITQ